MLALTILGTVIGLIFLALFWPLGLLILVLTGLSYASANRRKERAAERQWREQMLKK